MAKSKSANEPANASGRARRRAAAAATLPAMEGLAPGKATMRTHAIGASSKVFLVDDHPVVRHGLAQMIAMRVGGVPVVHSTGGLKDTVREGETGFLFQDARADSMQEALERALAVYAEPGKWQIIQRNDMQEDFSWPRSAGQYAKIYNLLVSYP